MTLLNKSHYCPYIKAEHQNLAYAEYANGTWCYSCNKGKFYDNTYNTTYKIVDVNNDIRLPVEYETNPQNFSPSILAWLYKYYVFNDKIRKFRITYVPYTEFTTTSGITFKGESLLYPLFLDNILVAYQRRFFPNKQVFSKNIQHYVMFNLPEHKKIMNTVVIVEDPVSALRVAEYAPCLCLYGTQINKKQISSLLWSFNNIIVWLDNDEPGQRAANVIIDKIVKAVKHDLRARAYRDKGEYNITNICFKDDERDPKAYSPSELEKILQGILN